MVQPEIYPGKELFLFRHATQWKKYFSRFLRPYINYPVMEVGAGIGSNTAYLHKTGPGNWDLLEPDPRFAEYLGQLQSEKKLPGNCRILNGSLPSQGPDTKYKTILYLDVLEHIENDAAELDMARQLLGGKGYLIVLAPAFPFLYSPFDKAIGHFRRYTRKSLKKLFPPSGGKLVCARYMDCAGFLASLANRVLLKQEYPTEKQVLFWDRWLIPVSRVLDLCFGRLFGKSVLIIWQSD